MSRTRARRRHPARGAALHPRVPRQDGGDQVRRRGDDRPRAQGGVRARRGAAQVRRHEPGGRPRRRPGDHQLHGAARTCRSSSSTACGSPTRPRSRWPRWSWSARSTRTSCCGSAATASPRSGCAATTACCSGPRARPRPSGQDIGFVGRIERVDVDVLTHVAQDYIPVVASVGADREGNSYNINADEAAGAVARALGAYKIMFLTDVAGWLRDPADPGQRRSPRPSADEVAEALRGHRRRDAAEARRLPGRDPRRRLVRPHRRRPRAALAAARAVHRRRAGHEDRRPDERRPVRVAGRAAGARARLRDPHLRPQPGPVRARRRAAGCGTRTATSTWTSWPGSRCSTSATAIRAWWRRSREQVGLLTHATNLYYTEPAHAAVGRGCPRARSAARCSSATPAPRPTRRRSSWPAGPARAAS